jgi:L-rhamnose mutarotase
VGVSRHVLTVDLRDDPAAIRAYVDHHRQVWPEVLDSLRRVGIRAMDIYLLARRLVMVVEVEEGTTLQQAFSVHRAAGGRVAEWERLMLSLQAPPPGAAPGGAWTPMEPVFHFEA